MNRACARFFHAWIDSVLRTERPWTMAPFQSIGKESPCNGPPAFQIPSWRLRNRLRAGRGCVFLLRTKPQPQVRRPFLQRAEPGLPVSLVHCDGQACEKYAGECVGYTDIEGVSPDPADPEPTIARELLLEIAQRTPGYSSPCGSRTATHPVSSWVTPTGRPSSISSLKSCPTSKAATGTMRSGCWSACLRTA